MSPRTPERWQRLDGLLDEALARPPDERTAFLRARCGHDPALYHEAVALLARLDEAERALGESVGPLAAGVYDGDGPGDLLAPGARVGPYRVEGEAGRGGMGVVYRATRADGAFEKEVALKLVKRGMDTDEVLARFRRERQLLAALDHPGIARLLDGGAAEDGRPYLAMEYVAGEPITAYADRKRLGVDARLDLFAQACEAVSYAHRRLVVHRDLKPSNVLVTEDERGQPQVKLLDFGIAKLLEEGADAAVTRTGAQRLTPAYAAPEQVRGEAAATAADVYALGVMLQELLAGRRPEGGLRPPSASVTPEAAGARGTTAERLRRRLRGDLDVICLKALREEPSERYPSVESLLDDLRRHRAGLPVEARPASAAYRVRKFVRRHRAGVGASAAFVLLLVAAVVALALQQRATARERDRAEAAAEQSREATRFLAGLFEESNPGATGGEALTALQVLDRGAARLDADLSEDPELRARLLYIIGDIHAKMERYEASLDLCERAYALQQGLFGAVHPDVASTLFCIASAHFNLGHEAEADSLFIGYEALLRVLPEETSPEHAQRLLFMGRVMFHRGAFDRALAYQQRAYALYRARYGVADKRSIQTGIEVAQTLSGQGAYDAADAWLRAMLAAVEQLPSAEEEERQNIRVPALFVLAGVLEERGRLAEAADTYGEAVAIRLRIDPLDTTLPAWLLQYGGVLRALGRFADAEGVFRDATARFQAQYGGGAFYAMHAQRLLGEAVCDQGRFADAEPLLTEAYARLREARGEEDAFTQGAVRALVTLYERWGRLEQAAAYRARVVDEGEAPAEAERPPRR